MNKLFKGVKKIFHPKSGLYSVLLGLMSFLAILVSLLTLQEMKAQRELSTMPIIHVQDFDSKKIHVDSSCLEMVYGDKIRLDNGYNEKLLIDGLTVENWFVLDLINIGQGSAVNLEVDWKVNFKWYLDFFKTLDLDPDVFKIEALKKGFYFKYKNCSNSASSASHSTGNVFKKSHLLSASNNVKGVKISVPKIMLGLHVAAIKARWLVEGQNKNNIMNLPVDHEFILSYESVNGNKYSEKYKATLTLTPPEMQTIVDDGGETKISASYEKFILEFSIEKI